MKSLPIAGQAHPERSERSDAQRNRVRILDAAGAIHERNGVDGLKMDAVAAHAGVGKGTVYRRFQDKAGLASALLDQRIRGVHAGMLTGPPPLGPGAPPRERLAAFVGAYSRHMLANIDLVLLAEEATPGGRLGRQVYPFWRHHVQILLVELEAPSPRFRAELVMAMLAAAQLHNWVVNQGWETDALIAHLQRGVDALATTP